MAVNNTTYGLSWISNLRSHRLFDILELLMVFTIGLECAVCMRPFLSKRERRMICLLALLFAALVEFYNRAAAATTAPNRTTTTVTNGATNAVTTSIANAAANAAVASASVSAVQRRCSVQETRIGDGDFVSVSNRRRRLSV